MFRDEQTLRSITCLETTNFEGYNMFREQTLRGITCLEMNKH